MSRRILNGWKEISGHIERSVRTAQRWEAQMRMPVHRPALQESGVVVAFTDELDGWICRTAPRAMETQPAFSASDREDQNLLRVLEDISTLVWDTDELACRMRLLQEQLRHSLHLYRHQFEARPTARTATPRGESLTRLLNFPARASDPVDSELTERSPVPEPHSR